MIEAVDLGVSYGVTPVLSGVDLAVSVGESVAVLGKSGSGKSTLLHSLAGMMPPHTGTVSIGGADLYSLDSERRVAVRRSHFGFIFQNHLLLPDLPVVENVALPLMLMGSRRKEACDAAITVLRELGIDSLSHRFPEQISGGESQRAAVARALVHEPSVLLADEPTGALDSRNVDVVVEALLEGTITRGVALVMVTHDPALSKACNRVLSLSDGRLGS